MTCSSASFQATIVTMRSSPPASKITSMLLRAATHGTIGPPTECACSAPWMKSPTMPKGCLPGGTLA
eukprot:scaffold2628_cov67-Phaeocystis_antarctica.AAC.2